MKEQENRSHLREEKKRERAEKTKAEERKKKGKKHKRKEKGRKKESSVVAIRAAMYECDACMQRGTNDDWFYLV